MKQDFYRSREWERFREVIKTERVDGNGDLQHFRFSFTVLNQSPTGFTLPTLRDYLGSSAGDYKQCSGVILTPVVNTKLKVLTGVRGDNINQFLVEGVNVATGAFVNLSLDWTQVNVLITDKVRQIV